MTPTEQDYEKLARTIILARGDDPEAMETVMRPGGGQMQIPAWQYEAIGDASRGVTATHETLDDFRASSKHWDEPGRCIEVDGGLYWAECRAMRGDRRCELCIVDCGEFRLQYQI